MNFNSFLFILLILLFPFGQLTRISIIRPDIILYLHDFIVITILVLNIKLCLKTIKKKAVLGFLAFALFSLFLSLSINSILEVLISSLYLFRFLAYFLLFFIYKKNKIENKYFYINSAVLISLVFSFVQYFFFPSLEPLFASGWDRHYFRLAGTWFDANFTGIILVLFFITIILQKIPKTKKVLTLFLISLAILLTYSRSTYLSFLASLLLLLFYQNKKNSILIFFRNFFKSKYFLLIIFFLLSIIFLPKKFGEGTKLLRTSTIISRTKNWQASLHLFTKNPLFGYGFNTLRYSRKNLNLIDDNWQTSHSASGTDNSIIFLFLTLGIIGFIQFTKLLKYLKNKIKNDQLYFAFFISILIHSMFQNTVFYPWVLLWIFLTLE